MFSSFSAGPFTRAARTAALAAALCTLPAGATAQQQVQLFGRIDVHGFAAQGFAKTDHNNFLTMNTRNGSGAFSDAGLNVGAKVTRKLRVGTQLYFQNVGELGNGKPQLDWVVADYRHNDVIGVRAGKVKTPLGLYNDTQDVGFLHTWALLPQAVYPLDTRSENLSHIGADAYGQFNLKRYGQLAYVGYFGERPEEIDGGFSYAWSYNGGYLESSEGWIRGGDLRWTTPVSGLMLGVSFVDQTIWLDGSRILSDGGAVEPVFQDTLFDQTKVAYAEYHFRSLRLNAEYRRRGRGITVNEDDPTWYDTRAGFVSAAYRFTPWLEVGSYHSRYDRGEQDDEPGEPDNFLNDTVVAARFDFARYFMLKVEGHFMDGHSNSATDPHGFYTAQNPDGFERKTKMLVVRTGFNF